MDCKNMSDFEILLRGFRAQEKKIERLSKLNKLLNRKNALLTELLVLERKETKK